MRGNLSNDIVSIKIEEGSKRPIALHEKSLFGKIEADTLNLSLIELVIYMRKVVWMFMKMKSNAVWIILLTF